MERDFFSAVNFTADLKHTPVATRVTVTVTSWFERGGGGGGGGERTESSMCKRNAKTTL